MDAALRGFGQGKSMAGQQHMATRARCRQEDVKASVVSQRLN